MKNYLEKFHYLSKRYYYICPIGLKKKKTHALVSELHHYRLHNTQVNRKKYPLLIDSLWNLMPVAHEWHMAYPGFGKTNPMDWDRRERFLERHPKINKFLQGETL